MSNKSPLRIILGAGNVGARSIDQMAKFGTPKDVKEFLDYFYSHGYRDLDTSRGYSPHASGTSEPLLGAVDAGRRFNIDTKVYSYGDHPHSREKIELNIDESLGALNISQVDVEYLHHPDRTTPFEESAEAMDKAYRQGKFRRFGLSNYSAEEVEKFVQICQDRGFVKPSVFQGQYNAIVRGGEKELFPVLRKYGIAFVAWSPAAAGFFAGNYKNVKPGDRYDTSHRLGQAYSSWYRKPTIESAVDRAVSVAESHGISGHSAAIRWTLFHSVLDSKYGDSVIIGASSIEQLGQNLDIIAQGPLPQEVANAFGSIHDGITDHEIPYHF